MTTCGSEEEGVSLARKLVEARLAACVQLKNIRSIYEWEGKVENDSEVQLVVKMDLAHYDEVETFIKRNHSYDTPQICATAIVAGSSEYLEFMRAQTRRDARETGAK